MWDRPVLKVEKIAKENLFYQEKSAVVALAFRNRIADSALSVKQQEKQRKVYTALPTAQAGMAGRKIGCLEREVAKAII